MLKNLGWVSLCVVLLATGCNPDNTGGGGQTTTTASSSTTTTMTSTSPQAPASEAAGTAAPSTASPEAAATASAAPASGSPSAKSAGGKTVTLPDGLKYTDIVEGTGPSPKPGDSVTVQYTGTLTNGTKFDSSYDHGTPFTFTIGVGQVIKGWDEGVMTMKKGGKRHLEIPPNLAYGNRAVGGVIPANSTLLFDVELVDVKPK